MIFFLLFYLLTLTWARELPPAPLLDDQKNKFQGCAATYIDPSAKSLDWVPVDDGQKIPHPTCWEHGNDNSLSFMVLVQFNKDNQSEDKENPSFFTYSPCQGSTLVADLATLMLADMNCDLIKSLALEYNPWPDVSNTKLWPGDGSTYMGNLNGFGDNALSAVIVLETLEVKGDKFEFTFGYGDGEYKSTDSSKCGCNHWESQVNGNTLVNYSCGCAIPANGYYKDIDKWKKDIPASRGGMAEG